MTRLRHRRKHRVPRRERGASGECSGKPNDPATVLKLCAGPVRQLQNLKTMIMSAKKTLLLVEDDPYDVAFVEEHLKRAPGNTRLRVVCDGVEAMLYVAGEGDYGDRRMYPKPDVILLDLKMPRWDGFEFLAWLRSQSPTQHRLIPVVVLSASKMPEDAARAYALGADSFLAKPLAWHNFQDAWLDHLPHATLNSLPARHSDLW
jgi:chemotaxis family two-component system response regulator Rcp1